MSRRSPGEPASRSTSWASSRAIADTPADEFLLTRYIVTCCVADATTAQVRVVNVPPGKFQANDWVEVRGPIYPLGQAGDRERDVGGGGRPAGQALPHAVTRRRARQSAHNPKMSA